ncbi:hypothetical protein [Nocardia australiensis]|uniref:hypothetical protein n=1 Tax=Nocardia australiensis TaxID=2887191 RepID=UPI001D14ADF8|nr:hypothetical protein [Nocardia australiensis]
MATFVDRALRGEGLAYAVIVEPMDTDIDQVRLKARADLAAAMSDLIEEGIAAGEFAEQDAKLRGAAIVGAFLEAVVAPLACRSEAPIDHNSIAVEIAQFCQGAVSAAHISDATPLISSRASAQLTGTEFKEETA